MLTQLELDQEEVLEGGEKLILLENDQFAVVVEERQVLLTEELECLGNYVPTLVLEKVPM